MTTTTPILLEEALDWIEQYGWCAFNPAFLSHDKHNFSDILTVFDSKSKFLKYFIAFIDQQTFENFQKTVQDITDPIDEKEIIWELLMTRFEVMNSYKSGIRRIWKDSIKTLDISSFYDHFCSDFDKKALQHLSTVGCMNQQLLTTWLKFPLILYGLRFSIFLTWIQEENQDLNSTMAAIDTYLDKMISFSKLQFF